MKTENIIALDIGSSKIAVAVGEVHDDSIALLGYGVQPAAGVRKGEIIDFENALVCVRGALSAAEEMSKVYFQELHLVVTGMHPQAVVNRGKILVANPQEGVSTEDMEEVAEIARNYPLPTDRQILHSIRQWYYLDGQDQVAKPEKIEARNLSLDMLILHVNAAKVRNAARLVKQIGCMEICGRAFSGLCSALAVLTPDQKRAGAVVIDLGAGTTDYFAYSGDVISAAGTFGVGGDHVTNDLAQAFSIPSAQAEKLKKNQGSALADDGPHSEWVTLAPEDGFAGMRIRRDAANLVIHARVEETLKLVREGLLRERAYPQPQARIFLTGGGAKMRGICELGRQIFGRPCSVGQAVEFKGASNFLEAPEHAAVLGMLRYAVEHPATHDTGPTWPDRIHHGVRKLLKNLGVPT
jgi:cell division protein FtsA